MSNVTATDAFNACPTVQYNYGTVYYGGTSKWGYPINACWTSDPLEYNSLKKWNDIANPSVYPWFSDGELYSFADGSDISHFTPRTPKPDRWKTLGVGAHHGGGQATNVGFADSSVRAVDIQEVLGATDGVTPDFKWFENK
jgi:prepilin-type processing-associated H-X9-DG protein